MVTVRDSARDVLRSCGLTTVFGNPGTTELSFLQDFPEDFHYVLGLHEGAVAAMADGYAQASGNAALVSLHSACGLGNAMGAVVNAWHNESPLVVIAGQQDRRHLLMEPYLYARSVELARPYVKWSYEPVRAQDVPMTIARAYATAVQPPRGPVFVSVPMDDWDERAAVTDPPAASWTSARTCPEPGAVDRLAAALDGSAAPVIVTGRGVDACKAWEPVVELARRLAAPVWAAPQASRAGFPEDHALFQGHLPAAREPMARCLAGHDLMLLLGAPAFSYLTYTDGATRLPRLVHLSEDPGEIVRSDNVVGVVGDIRLSVEALLEKLNSNGRQAEQPQPRREAEPQLPSRPISPGYLMQELAAALPDDAILVEESPSNRREMRDHVRILRQGSFYATASGGLGFAMPAAVGIKLAQPERPVVCLVGDGSTMYAPQALWTAAREKLDVLFVVVDNGEYGILRSVGEQSRRKGVPGTLVEGIDYTGLAQSLGCDARRVEDPGELLQALRDSLAKGLHLIDVPVSSAIGTL